VILELIAQEAARPPRERRRPPRHARPKGWTGPTMPAPSPPVATWTPEQRAAFGSISPTWKLSPLSRESLRRRFRIMWAVHTGRPVV
jgi:hypothetical protein